MRPLLSLLETTWDAMQAEAEPEHRSGPAAKARLPWTPNGQFIYLALERYQYCCWKGALHMQSNVFLARNWHVNLALHYGA